MRRLQSDLVRRANGLTLPAALSLGAAGLIVLVALGLMVGRAVQWSGARIANISSAPPRNQASADIGTLYSHTGRLSRRIDTLEQKIGTLTAQNRLLSAKLNSLEGDFGTVTVSMKRLTEERLRMASAEQREAQAAHRSVHRKASLDRESDDGMITGSIRRGPVGGANREVRTVPASGGKANSQAPSGAPGNSEASNRESKRDAQAREIARMVPPAARTGQPQPTRSRFAIRLASYTSVDGLKLVWKDLLETHNLLLAGLEPRTVAYREENGRPRIDLIAGPMGNAAEATEICAKLHAENAPCEPTAFGGDKFQ